MKFKYIIAPFVSATLFVSCNKTEDTTGEAAQATAKRETATVEAPAQEAPVEEVAGVQSLQQKLKTIIIPKVDFVDMSVKECLEILRLRAIEFDPETDENRKGVNFMIQTQPDAADIGDLKVDELRLTNVPLGTTLQYICGKARLRYKINEHAVIILPLPEDVKGARTIAKDRGMQEFNMARKEYQTALSIRDQMALKYDVEKTKTMLLTGDDPKMKLREEQLKAIKVEIQKKTDRVAELRKRLSDIAEKHGILLNE